MYKTKELTDKQKQILIIYEDLIKRHGLKMKPYFMDLEIFYQKGNPLELIYNEDDSKVFVRDPYPEQDKTLKIFEGKQVRTALKYLLGIRTNDNPDVF